VPENRTIPTFDDLKGKTFYPDEYYYGLYGMPLSNVTALREKNGLPQVPKEGWDAWFKHRQRAYTPITEDQKNQDLKSNDRLKSTTNRYALGEAIPFINNIASLMAGKDKYLYWDGSNDEPKQVPTTGITKRYNSLNSAARVLKAYDNIEHDIKYNYEAEKNKGHQPLYGGDLRPVTVLDKLITGDKSGLQGELDPTNRTIQLADTADYPDRTLYHEMAHSNSSLPEWNKDRTGYMYNPNETQARLAATMPGFIKQYGSPVLDKKSRDAWFEYIKKSHKDIYDTIKWQGYTDKDIKFLGGAVVDSGAKREGNYA
jgi:hypothetical protein